MNPDLKAYIDTCQAQGIAPEAIIANLEKAGWSEVDLAPARALLMPEPVAAVPPALPDLPAETPAAGTPPADPITTTPITEATPAAAAAPKRILRWILAAVVLILLGAAGYFGYRSLNPDTFGGDVTSQESTDSSATTFSTSDFSFQYPASWTLRDFGATILLFHPTNAYLAQENQSGAVTSLLEDTLAADSFVASVEYEGRDGSVDGVAVAMEGELAPANQVRKHALTLGGSQENVSSCTFGGQSGWCVIVPADPENGRPAGWSFVVGTSSRMHQILFRGVSSSENLTAEQRFIMDSFRFF